MRRFLPTAGRARGLVWMSLLLLFGLATPAPAQPTKAEHDSFAQTKAQAEKGDAEAQLRLASCYTRGAGVAKDPAKAAKWHRKAAEQGLARAQYQLGLDYAGGIGVKPSETEAIHWFRKAAEQGLTEAQLDLGLCYINGSGVEVNGVEAVRLFRLAASQGSAAAECELAKCYFQGTGAAKNLGEAFKWLRQAAEQGHPAAQYRLGICYQKGEAVARDNVQAYKWFALASAQDDEHAADIQVDMAKVETQMTPEQVALAQRLAAEFKPGQKAESAPAPASTAPAQPQSSTNDAGPATGSVNVKADDESSEVFVDGAFVGNPPAQLKLAAGAHVIEVKKAGCKAYQRTITVSPGADLTLRAVLEKQ